jgi:hypothetical protein
MLGEVPVRRLHQRQHMAAVHRERFQLQRHLPTQLQGGRGVEELHQLWPEQPAAAEPHGQAGDRVERHPPGRQVASLASGLWAFDRQPFLL